MSEIKNPFKPGAGHQPPYLAGRDKEKNEFSRLITQTTILDNLVLTGLRGTGKTVLLEQLKPIAQQAGWLWIGADLSESASLNEAHIATRLLTDLSVITSSIIVKQHIIQGMGFLSEPQQLTQTLSFFTLTGLYEQTPGLPLDKIKYVLEFVWSCLKDSGYKGIVFAYDEAQNLSDHAAKEQYPLSLLLDTFQSLQRKDIPFMLALTGLPTLFPKLVGARTFTERMFRVVFLDRLSDDDVREAILKPLEQCDLKLTDDSVAQITALSGGYPYFVQFICREIYDLFIQKINHGEEPTVPSEEIIRKLDSDFFSARWSRVTDRQKDLLTIISKLENCDTEFSVQEVVQLSKEIAGKSFGSSHINQMLLVLIDKGLVFKNRHGKYSFAVPLLGQFIRRQEN